MFRQASLLAIPLLLSIACGLPSEAEFTELDSSGGAAPRTGSKTAGSEMGASGPMSASGAMSSSGGSAGSDVTGSAGASFGGVNLGGASFGGVNLGGASGASTDDKGRGSGAGLGGMAWSTAGASSTGGVGSAGSAGSAGAYPGPADIVPLTGALLGAYVDSGELESREQLLNRQLDIHSRVYSWMDDWISGQSTDDVAAGRVPMITWQPHTVPLPDITAGKYDELVRARARAAKKLAKPLLLRFAHEMNGDWYSWGGPKNGNEQGVQKYKEAWRHLHDLFSVEGADNVLWVWCPNSDSVPNVGWNQPTAYYPGDSYVDWVAIDGYNWGTTPTWGVWRSFEDILSPVYASFAALGKPFMVAETGSTEAGGDKAAWFNAMQIGIKSFPAVKALVYFDGYDVNRKLDFKFDSSPKALKAFKALSLDPYFNP